uniref:Uncharacterized protein n=1 Tax=Quercus lobata TaxID=97700 RepID=A0A7N2LFR3_QUELO
MLGFEVLSRSAYLYTICRDATNTCEVDTPIKAPNVLFNSFLGSIAHNQTLKSVFWGEMGNWSASAHHPMHWHGGVVLFV